MKKEKAYDLGYGCLGNGTTVWNRLEEVNRDYRTVAHISDEGSVKIYDNDLPETAKAEIRRNAATWSASAH